MGVSLQACMSDCVLRQGSLDTTVFLFVRESTTRSQLNHIMVQKAGRVTERERIKELIA